ncbi:hypothetical protein QJ48_30160 [Paenibacillus sp. A3]|uniref:DUF5689 domain-containing protein n=1 Tax=Paenibacillus sp. A3 TaxID=1337054 RepID=UPI0006D5427C|nr:DUF5689 domain-containing protein [Paenibacillus sp. A3]KPV55992.1 hypothetical protein QJ48_30160 [Paenibacillus sp. A3]
MKMNKLLSKLVLASAAFALTTTVSQLPLGTIGIQKAHAAVVTIASAKSQIGSTVTVEGIVTANNTAIGGGKLSTFIQDATGGINVFAQDVTPFLPQLVEGEKIQVTGQITTYQGLTEIVPTTITRVSTGNQVPAPQVIPFSTLNNGAQAEPLEGKLVKVNQVYIGALPTVQAGGGYNITIYDNNYNSSTLRVMNDTGIFSGLQANKWYEVTAILGEYNSYQLVPRKPADVSLLASQPPAPVPATKPIATAKNLTGQVVTVEGTVLANNSAIGGGKISTYIQDATGGINVFAANPTGYINLAEGDKVRVTGTITVYNGLTEIIPTSAATVTKTGTAPMPAAVTKTVPELTQASAAEPLESTLVKTVKVKINSLPTNPAGGGYNITAVDANNNSILLRVMQATNIYPTLQTGVWYDVTGVLSQYNSYQLVPRKTADVVVSP